ERRAHSGWPFQTRLTRKRNRNQAALAIRGASQYLRDHRRARSRFCRPNVAANYGWHPRLANCFLGKGRARFWEKGPAVQEDLLEVRARRQWISARSVPHRNTPKVMVQLWSSNCFLPL